MAFSANFGNKVKNCHILVKNFNFVDNFKIVCGSGSVARQSFARQSVARQLVARQSLARQHFFLIFSLINSDFDKIKLDLYVNQTEDSENDRDFCLKLITCEIIQFN
jgi:hypothetical protein